MRVPLWIDEAMKWFFCIVFAALLAGCATSIVSRLSSAQALQAASELWMNMPEEEANRILTEAALVPSSRGGCEHGWFRHYFLSDGNVLVLRIEPESGQADAAWVNGKLKAAHIADDRNTIVQISLAEKPGETP